MLLLDLIDSSIYLPNIFTDRLQFKVGYCSHSSPQIFMTLLRRIFEISFGALALPSSDGLELFVPESGRAFAQSRSVARIVSFLRNRFPPPVRSTNFSSFSHVT